MLEREGRVRFERNRGVRVLERRRRTTSPRSSSCACCSRCPAAAKACGIVDTEALQAELDAMARPRAGDEPASWTATSASTS